MQLLAERHIIKSTEHRFVEIDKLAFQSQNLYNAANYVIRQSWSMDGVTLITKKWTVWWSLIKRTKSC